MWYGFGKGSGKLRWSILPTGNTTPTDGSSVPRGDSSDLPMICIMGFFC
ncbi:hypothetical protein Hanom_Chr15g01360761 [Helianthus anomalus]